MSQPTFGAADRGHLGDAAAGLVDGALSHAERDLALSHIAHCDPCRLAVEQQRTIKARVGSLAHVEVPGEVMSRLLAIRSAGPAPASPPARSLNDRRLSRRSRTAPAYLPRRSRRVVVSTSALLAGAAALLLAVGGGEREPGSPVQPPLATLVDQHAATAPEQPFSDPGMSAITAGFSK